MGRKTPLALAPLLPSTLPSALRLLLRPL